MAQLHSRPARAANRRSEALLAFGRTASTGTAPVVRPRSALAGEVTRLLRGYPELAPAETRRLIESFRALPILEAALLTTDERIRPRLDAFRRDHKWAIRPPLWNYLLTFVVPATLAAALGWGLWQAVLGG